MEINENEKPQMAIEDDSTSRKKRLKIVVIVRTTQLTESQCNFKILTEPKHIFFFTHLWSTVTLRSELKGWKQEREKSYHVSFSSQTIVPFLSNDYKKTGKSIHL